MKKFNYEKKLYSTREKINLPILNSGVIDILPRELGSLRGKVLDIGCGAGYYSGGILKKKFPKLEVYGVDVSRNAIGTAKKDFPQVRFVVGDVYKLPFPDSYFDAITSNCTLEHLEKPKEALREIRRIMKKNAFFFSITPIEGDKFVFFQDETLAKRFHGHLQRFSKSDLINLMENNGFKIIRYYFWGFFLCQLVSGVYLRLFKFLNLPREFQIKNYIESGNPALQKRLLTYIRYFVNILINLESLLIPKKATGLYMNIVAKKTLD